MLLLAKHSNPPGPRRPFYVLALQIVQDDIGSALDFVKQQLRRMKILGYRVKRKACNGFATQTIPGMVYRYRNKVSDYKI